MKPDALRQWIDDLTDDIEFQYNGIHGSICPFNRSDISVSYGNYEKTVTSVDAAMQEPFIDGKSLQELCERIEFG